MSRLLRPHGNELSGFLSVVDMLVHDHRRHTNQISFRPTVLRAVVEIVAAAFDHQQKFLENVAMLTASLARSDFLRHHIQPARRHFGPPADVEFKSSLPGVFPRAVRGADHARIFSLRCDSRRRVWIKTSRSEFYLP